MGIEEVANRIHQCKIAIIRCDEGVENIEKTMTPCIERSAIIRGLTDAKREWEIEKEKWRNHENWKRRLEDLPYVQ